MIVQSRRSFITGLAALVAAPAVVRASSLMPVKAPKVGLTLEELNQYLRRPFPDYERAWALENARLDVLYSRVKIGSQLRIRLPDDYKVHDGS